MKPLLFPILLASTFLLAAADNPPPISGKWQIHNSIAGNESDMTCTLTQKQAELTGTCSSDNGSVNISGSVDNKRVNWVYKSEYNGGPITLTYKGTVESADKITGSVTVEEYGVDGDFTATPSK